MQPLDKLLMRWRSENVEPLPPESEDAVRSAFLSVGMDVTSDVLRVYEVIGGMRRMDNQGLQVWSLAQVAAQTPSSLGPVFADFLISSWECRLRRVNDEVSEVYVDHSDGNPPSLIASSVGDFVDRYEADATWLYTI